MGSDIKVDGMAGKRSGGKKKAPKAKKATKAKKAKKGGKKR